MVCNLHLMSNRVPTTCCWQVPKGPNTGKPNALSTSFFAHAQNRTQWVGRCAEFTFFTFHVCKIIVPERFGSLTFWEEWYALDLKLKIKIQVSKFVLNCVIDMELKHSVRLSVNVEPSAYKILWSAMLWVVDSHMTPQLSNHNKRA